MMPEITGFLTSRYYHMSQLAVKQYEVKDDPMITKIFDKFAKADGFDNILTAFNELCDYLEIDKNDHRNIYNNIKNKVNVWRAKALFQRLDVKKSQSVFQNGEACKNIKALVIGGGPCGLRSAIELAMLGAEVVVLEKRSYTSRNNVLSLWPFVVQDLKSIGAKDFWPNFCVGGMDHISIRILQCVLLKTALLLGVVVYTDVAFKDIVEPPEDQSSGMGWRCNVEPCDHVVNDFQFNVVIGADGKRHSLSGFKRQEFRGKLAIAITANFINRKTRSEAMVPEICGLSYLYSQAFFKEIKSKTDIELENVVYFKAPTHYFVFTAKKESLLKKRVLKQDFSKPCELLHADNINQDQLENYAKQTASETTQNQLKDLEYALNRHGKPDIAIFDFTCLSTAEYSCRMLERKGHQLLETIVGDSLLEPFWPSGTGAAKGFLGVLDSAWMIRQWSTGEKTPLEIMAERETTFQMLPQCGPEALYPSHESFTSDPSSRYKNLHTLLKVKPEAVKHLYDGDDQGLMTQVFPSDTSTQSESVDPDDTSAPSDRSAESDQVEDQTE